MAGELSLFTRYSGTLLVKIRGVGEHEAQGNNQPLFTFILCAYVQLAGPSSWKISLEQLKERAKILRFSPKEKILEVEITE